MNREQGNVFDIFKTMNVDDAANGTHNLVVSPYFIDMTKTKQGGKVCMGVPDEIVSESIFRESRMFILLCIDKTEYNKLKALTLKGDE